MFDLDLISNYILKTWGQYGNLIVITWLAYELTLTAKAGPKLRFFEWWKQVTFLPLPTLGVIALRQVYYVEVLALGMSLNTVTYLRNPAPIMFAFLALLIRRLRAILQLYPDLQKTIEQYREEVGDLEEKIEYSKIIIADREKTIRKLKDQLAGLGSAEGTSGLW